MAFYKVPNPKRTKLGLRALKSIFVGYAVNSKAYRLLDVESNVIVESRDVEFFKNKFINDSMETNHEEECREENNDTKSFREPIVMP